MPRPSRGTCIVPELTRSLASVREISCFDLRGHDYARERVLLLHHGRQVENVVLRVSGDLQTRVQQHKNHVFEGFTDKYNVERLVYFERYREVIDAITREKQVKRWSRAKKVWLIERENPTWDDLAEDWGKPMPWFKLQPKEK